jgi:DNA transformation protein
VSNNEYANFILDLFADYGSITLRAMFGGYGVYKNSVIFALVADDEIYFKVNKDNMHQYVTRGSEAFSYERKGKIIKMSYWKLPIEILESSEELKNWIDQSYQISLKAK